MSEGLLGTVAAAGASIRAGLMRFVGRGEGAKVFDAS